MPDTIRTADFVNNLFTLLTETFESPLGASSAYLDQSAGLFTTLAGLSAKQASKPITPTGTSVAAQVEHIRFYLDVVEQFMNGRTEKVDWTESWQTQEVTFEAWEGLRGDLDAAHKSVIKTFRNIDTWDDDEIGDSLAILIHTAYHLGAIRQIVKVIT